ncbi:MAG: response regulator [Candidatus Melainabacteria bacterium]|nr:response regulator [Candidatus Melainabacteria bacterium]
MKIEKIFLVDDDPNIRRIAEISLKKLGPWQVELASSGRELLAMLEKDKPDLLILDVMMPEMDGPTTFQSVKNQFPGFKQPVIFMTAKVMSHEVDEYLVLGAAGVICKPFNPKDLADDVRRICAEWESRLSCEDAAAESSELLVGSGD